MRHRFHNAKVEIEGGFDEVFPVARYATGFNDDILRAFHAVVQCFKHFAESLKTITVIALVVGVNDFGMLIEQYEFGGGASRIHAKEVGSGFCASQFSARNVVEVFVFILCCNGFYGLIFIDWILIVENF